MQMQFVHVEQCKAIRNLILERYKMPTLEKAFSLIPENRKRDIRPRTIAVLHSPTDGTNKVISAPDIPTQIYILRNALVDVVQAQYGEMGLWVRSHNDILIENLETFPGLVRRHFLLTRPDLEFRRYEGCEDRLYWWQKIAEGYDPEHIPYPEPAFP